MRLLFPRLPVSVTTLPETLTMFGLSPETQESFDPTAASIADFNSASDIVEQLPAKPCDGLTVSWFLIFLTQSSVAANRSANSLYFSSGTDPVNVNTPLLTVGVTALETEQGRPRSNFSFTSFRILASPGHWLAET
jgi:hypothetical protein